MSRKRPLFEKKSFLRFGRRTLHGKDFEVYDGWGRGEV